MGENMHYSGGKERIASKISMVLQPYVDESGVYIEPFLGGASVFARIKAQEKHGSDANPWLMTMWQACLDGWSPPDTVSEDEYADIKRRKPKGPITAFVGFGCSFGGKWFGGYARCAQGKSYAAVAQRSIARKIAGFGAANLRCVPYDRSSAGLHSNAVIYCDPPYINTTDCYSTDRFDSERFWGWVRKQEVLGHSVFVSEYVAPDDFVAVAEFPKKVTMDKSNGYTERIEKLFRLSQ